jgi:hypothetical protein
VALDITRTSFQGPNFSFRVSFTVSTSLKVSHVTQRTRCSSLGSQALALGLAILLLPALTTAQMPPPVPPEKTVEL